MSKVEILKKMDKYFYPFTLNKTLPQIKIGRFTFEERWKLILRKCNGKNNTIFYNLLPTIQLVDYISVHKKLPTQLKKYCIVLNTIIDIVKNIEAIIKVDIALLSTKKTIPIPDFILSKNSNNIFIEENTFLYPSFFNTEYGAIYISKNVTIQEGVCLRGPIYIGENTVVKMGATIFGNTIIGNNCLVGGEIKNAIIMDNSNKGHFGYLGDSIIGSWCNLGAGTSNSNVKNNASSIEIDLNQKKYNAGKKFGLLMGDYSKSAINTSFNTGTVVGVCSSIFANGLTPKSIPSFSYGINGEKYLFEKAIQDIQNWMDFKGVLLKKKEITILKNIYNEKN